MHARRGCVWTYVLDANRFEREWLADVLTFKTSGFNGYRFVTLKRRLFDKRKMRFPSGLLRLALKRSVMDGISLKVSDSRHKPPERSRHQIMRLEHMYSYQQEMIDAALEHTTGIWCVATGGGKCLGIGTRVLLYNGYVIPVEKIRVGDVLTGPDGKGRDVLSVTLGFGTMYQIVPEHGDTWTCNYYHVLTLLNLLTDEVVDVPLCDWFLWSEQKRHVHCLIRPRVIGYRYSTMLRVSFSVKCIGYGAYAGFTLSGDGRFLLGDATVTHNTEAAIGLALAVPGNTLFIVDEKALLYQTVNRYTKYVDDCAGIIGDGKFLPGKFTVATGQTLYSKIREASTCEFFKSISCVIFDECHTTSSPETFWAISTRLTRAYYRIGMSATPLNRSDGMDMYTVAATGPIIYKMPLAKLAYVQGDKQKISRPIAIFYEYPRPTTVESSWPQCYIDGVVNCEERNRAVVRLCRIAPKPCLVFYEDIKHRHWLILQTMLEKFRYTVGVVGGYSDADARQQAIEKLNAGELDILLASKIFNKGTDIPEVRACINAAGKRAYIASVQKLGRGLRKTKRKNRVIFLDLLDRHSITLEDHSDARVAAYESLDIPVRKLDGIAGVVKCINRFLKRRRGVFDTIK